MTQVESAATPCPRFDHPRFVVLGAADKGQVQDEAPRIRAAIEQYGEIVCWNLGFTENLSDVEADLVVVLGGDGSILRAAHQMGQRQLPVIGVNLGKLGFLADLSPDEFLEMLPHIVGGKCRVIEHLMYECQHVRDGEVVHERLGLNEVAVLCGYPFGMLEAHLYVDAELVTTYSCDGLIVATPVGSTAHSLSSGGPILRKDLQAFVISPVSPHTLTNRPVVDSADRVYEIVVPQPHEGTAVVLDGEVLDSMKPADRLIVRRAKPQFKLIEAPGRGYYRTLREKLGWGGRLNAKRR